jgi:response regulator RpfG family c-di-GMP phosphodiesterase
MGTEQKKVARILVVEDDPTTLKIIKTILSNQPGFEILTATNGKEGFAVAKAKKPDIIISDYSMPIMDGLELCAAIKKDKELSSIIFILLTAISETNKKIQSFDIGVDDYLVKPYNPSELISKIKAFLKIKFLQDQLRSEKANLSVLNDLLEKSMYDLAYLVLNIMELYIPEATKRGKQAAEIAVSIAKRLDLDELAIKDIEYAALLHEIGKLSIPKELITRKYKSLSQQERDMVKQHPVLAQLSLSVAPKMRAPGTIIRHQFENYDGTGYPDRLVEAEIPMGSRILRVIVDFEDLITEPEIDGSVEKALGIMERGIRSKYQPQIFNFFVDCVSEIPEGALASDSVKVTIFDLKEGMMLARDVFTSAGIKLLPKGADIKLFMIDRIITHNTRDPISGGIFITKNSYMATNPL